MPNTDVLLEVVETHNLVAGLVDDFGIIVTWDTDWYKMRAGWWPEHDRQAPAAAARAEA